MSALTVDKAKADYQEAIDILGDIATSPDSTPAARNAARASAKELTLDYLADIEEEIKALTKQYRRFIKSMSGLIEDLDGNSPVDILDRLSELVDDGSKLVSAAKGGTS
jgi:hypothetical protein